MEKQAGKGDGNANGDCTDDDLLKGSDDAVNVVKSPKHTSSIQLDLPYKTYNIFIGTIVSFIGVMVTVLMLFVISNDDQKNVFQLTKDISRISNQLEILSKEKNSHSSKTDGQPTCKNINNSYLYYALQEENRKLKDELQKTKSRKDDQKYLFQLSKDVSRIWNQLESLLSKVDSHNSRPDGPQTCDKINTSYLYYAIQKENIRLKDELKITKSRKDDQKNGCQLTKDMSRISNQLEGLSSKIDSHRSKPDGQQTCEKANTNYLNYAFQEENKRLKDELQKTKSGKDSIICEDTDDKPNQQEGREEQYRFSSNSVQSPNNMNGWVVANRSLSFGSSDHFNIEIQFRLSYPEISDNGKILFEFGLTTLADGLIPNYPTIIVRGQRCGKEPGMCLYVIDNVLTKLEDHVFDQMSDYIQGQLTLGLHKSYFVLMSNQKNIYISNMLNISSKVELWPVFGFYNTHLINISQTIISENKISFNRTTVDPHFFVSEDNSTISNCNLRSKRTSHTRWEVSLMISETAFFMAFTVICYLLTFKKTYNDTFVDIPMVISFIISFFLGTFLSLYYLYMNWSLHLTLVAIAFLGNLLYELRKNESKMEPGFFFLVTLYFSTYIAVFLKRSDMFYLIFY